LCISGGQIVVDRDHVHAFAREGVQIDRQRGCQRLAFARPHFGNLAGMQRHTPFELDIKVAHLHDPLARFAHRGKGLGQQGIQRLALGQPRFELWSFGLQLLVGQLLELRLQRMDANHSLSVGLQQPFIAAAKKLGQ